MTLKRNSGKNAVAIIIGFIALWYAGAMLNFFPFSLGNDLILRAVGFTGLLLCAVLVICTCWIIDEIYKSSAQNKSGTGRMTIAKMKQSEAVEIADRWKYDGEYAFYDMTADPEDYKEIVSPELRGDKYFSIYAGETLAGFFCVEREGTDVELGLGMRPDLTGQGRGRAFLEEILCFVREHYEFEKLWLSVAAFNRRAIHLYEQAGFIKTGTAQVPTNGGVYDFILMELKR